MMTPRFIIDESVGDLPADVCLRDEEHHHLKNVLRLSQGDYVELISRVDSRAYKATISSVEKQKCVIHVREQITALKLPRVQLLIGLSKPKICDEVIEKVTEIGVAGVHFFNAERSQQRLTEKDTEKRLARWQRIIDSALKQSSFHCFPALSLHPSLDECLKQLTPKPNPASRRYVLVAPGRTRAKNTPLLSDVITQETSQASRFPANSTAKQSAKNAPPEPIELSSENAESYLIVGPEGGLTELEIANALRYGFFETSIGIKTLRVETAALFSCALLCSCD